MGRLRWARSPADSGPLSLSLGALIRESEEPVALSCSQGPDPVPSSQQERDTLGGSVADSDKNQTAAQTSELRALETHDAKSPGQEKQTQG